ncbi:hypothetical protein GE09DRAFT_1159323 [Coniochaeta sp. 2T2.1]|nr:hypothetical protein GE09DRAFT_1159323 [Coniochaeta sp. 2T2.1]
MESFVFPSAVQTCTCQAIDYSDWKTAMAANQFGNSGVAGISHVPFPDTTSQIFTDTLTSCPYSPLQIPIDPSLSSEIPSDLSLTANLLPPAIPKTESDTASWMQRLESLEHAVGQLEDPVKAQHPRQDWSKLEELERTVERTQSKIREVQQAVFALESWAEMMNGAYKEFKGVVCEVFKLVNSRQHLSSLLNPFNASEKEPFRAEFS